MSTGNQRVVQHTEKDLGKQFATMSYESLREAMCCLSGAEFKLWMYFQKNKEGYKFECTVADAATWGITRTSYHRAFQKLIELGYLVEKSKNYYLFYERPQKRAIVEKVPMKEGFVF